MLTENIDIPIYYDFKIFSDESLSPNSILFHAQIRDKNCFDILVDKNNSYSFIFRDIINGVISYSYIVNNPLTLAQPETRKFNILGGTPISNFYKFIKEYQKLFHFTATFSPLSLPMEFEETARALTYMKANPYCQVSCDGELYHMTKSGEFLMQCLTTNTHVDAKNKFTPKVCFPINRGTLIESKTVAKEFKYL